MARRPKLPQVEPFQLFGIHHLAALLLVALASATCFALGRSHWSDHFNKAGMAIFLFWAIALWSLKLRDGLDWDLDLPLALCDVVFIIGFICFLSPSTLLLTYLTYWGLGGTLQALITPDVKTAFPSAEFTIFFLGHSTIVFAVFFLLGRNSPQDLTGWKGVKNSFSGLLVYTLIVGLIDLAFGVNYGYLLRKPEGASLLDYLGPWPVYVLAGLGIALIIFSLLSVALKFLPEEREA